jgi:hypothetical protein
VEDFTPFLVSVVAAGPPALKSLDDFPKLLVSSRKYGMVEVEKMIVVNLVAPSFLEIEPMRIFALACRFGLEAEARVAAKHTLRIPILGRKYFADIENMSAMNFHLLQEYHYECGKAASKVARNTEWVEKKSFAIT